MSDIIINAVFRADDSDLQTTEKLLGDIEQSLKAVGSQKDLDRLTTEFGNLNAVVDESTLSFSEMGKAIETYQSIALKAGAESPIGKEAIARAGGLKQQMDELTRSVDTLAQKGQNLQATLEIGTTVVAGYGAYLGITQLLGKENENLEKAFVKLQAVQAALMSIEQIRMALQKESILVQKAQSVWRGAEIVSTKIMIALRGQEAVATGAATVATRALTAALIATGIGAIIVALGSLIAYWDKVTEAVKKSVEWLQEVYYKFQDLGAGAKIAISVLFPMIGMFYALAEAAEYYGFIESKEDKKARIIREKQLAEMKKATKEKIDNINKEIEANKKLTEEVTASIDFEIEKKKAAGEDYAKLEKDKLMLLVRSAQMEIGLINEKIKAKEEELKMYDKFFDWEASMIQAQINSYEKSKDEQKKFLEEQLQNIELFNIKQEKIRKDAAAKNYDAEAEELNKFEARTDNIIKANKRGIDSIEADQLDYKQRSIDSTIAYYDEIGKITDENLKKRKAEEQALFGYRVGLAGEAFSAIASLTEAFGTQSESAARRQFAITKGFNLAAAVMQTFQAVTGALTAGGNPIKLASGAQFVEAGIALTTGLAAITRIANTKFEPSSGGSAPSFNASITTPVANTSSSVLGGQDFGNTTTNVDDIIQGQINGEKSGMQSNQVLVVGSYQEVEKKQNKIKALATYK